MYPRIVLLRELLSEDGSIWLSIDDDESHYLKVLCDEVFGRGNFIVNALWQKRTSPDARLMIGDAHDHILVYAKNVNSFKLNLLDLTEDQKSKYKNPDNDPRGPWVSSDFSAQGFRPNQMYEITSPSGKVHTPPVGSCWKNTESRYLEQLNEGRFWFGKDGKGVPRRKNYLSEVAGRASWSWWPNSEVGHNQEAKKEINDLFGKADAFATPKPERLISRILGLATNVDDVVLDSFLGSGTTAAVAHKMGRRYIGIEMGDHAKTHCVPRLQKVIDGEQGGISKAVEWVGGGGFSFCSLSSPAFDQQGQINPEIKFPDLASFVWHLETGLPGNLKFETPLLGVHNGTAYYLLYNGILGDKKPLGGNVLNNAVLKAIHEILPFDGPKVIYGEAVRLGANKLDSESITFKQIPYDINLV